MPTSLSISSALGRTSSISASVAGVETSTTSLGKAVFDFTCLAAGLPCGFIAMTSTKPVPCCDYA